MMFSNTIGVSLCAESAPTFSIDTGLVMRVTTSLLVSRYPRRLASRTWFARILSLPAGGKCETVNGVMADLGTRYFVQLLYEPS